MASSDALKSQLKALQDQRSALEAEIAERSARLEAAGVGMDAPLVDQEGYPRADVDVAAIRGHRHAIITLTNDHKALTRQMEQLLHQLHGLSAGAGTGARSGAAPAAAAASYGAAQARHAIPSAALQQNGAAGNGVAPQQAAQQPFAVIDEVAAGSPAAAAGLHLGDQLCSFAGVTKQTPSVLQAVAAALPVNEGREVEAVVLRHGAPLTLRLTPRQWGGRGLLGCHLRPL